MSHPESDEPKLQHFPRTGHKFGHREMVMTPEGVGSVSQFGADLTYLVHIPRDEEILHGQNSKWFPESDLTELTDEQYRIHCLAFSRM